MTNRVIKVYVEKCCGTWCIYLETTTGDPLRIAYFGMYVGGKTRAKTYAEKVRKFFKIRKKVEFK